jgi:hypothetical protein
MTYSVVSYTVFRLAYGTVQLDSAVFTPQC